MTPEELAAVRERNVLAPHVARPSEIADWRTALHDEGTGNPAPAAREAVDWTSPLDGAGGMTIIPRPKHHAER